MASDSSKNRLTGDIACIGCQSQLVPAAIAAEQTVRCCLCGTQFVPVPAKARDPARRRAAWSFGLGLLSLIPPFVFLTAIPAIWIGAKTLKKLRRSGQQGRAQGLALAGVVMGGLAGAFWAMLSLVCVVAVAFFMLTFNVTRQPDEIGQIAGRIGTFDMPSQVQPVRGLELLGGIRTVVYADKEEQNERDISITILQFNPMFQVDHHQMARQLRTQVRQQAKLLSSETRSLDVNGRPVEIEIDEVSDRRNDQRSIVYTAVVPTGAQNAVVVMELDNTNQMEQQQDFVPAMSQEEVDRFFQSFR